VRKYVLFKEGRACFSVLVETQSATGVKAAGICKTYLHAEFLKANPSTMNLRSVALGSHLMSST
jgi:hypothetical protein